MLYARYLCSRDALGLACRPSAAIGYLVYKVACLVYKIPCHRAREQRYLAYNGMPNYSFIIVTIEFYSFSRVLVCKIPSLAHSAKRAQRYGILYTTYTSVYKQNGNAIRVAMQSYADAMVNRMIYCKPITNVNQTPEYQEKCKV